MGLILGLKLRLNDEEIVNSYLLKHDRTIPEGKLTDIHRALNESSIVAFTDVDGNITYVNDKFCEISKYSRKELIGQNHRIINSGYHSRELFTDLWSNISTGKVWKGEIRNQAKDGTHYWVFTTVVPFLNDHGRPYQYASIRTEITELKKIEEQRDKVRLDLERAKIEEELRQQFISTLSHDLRSPLSAARLSVQLMQHQVEDADKVSDLAARALRNIDRVDSMIADFLDTNKVKAGQRLPIEVGECDIKQVTEKPLENLSAIYGNRFIFHHDGTSIGYWSSSGINRIVENLCSNAIKYGDSGLVTVKLAALETQVELSVHNTGKPIPDEQQRWLFDYLHRTKSAHASDQKGWGIGLTLVKAMAEAHGGHVSVQSSETEGTTFVVRIPRDSRLFQKASQQ